MVSEYDLASDFYEWTLVLILVVVEDGRGEEELLEMGYEDKS